MVAGFRTTLSPLTSWFRIPLMARCTRYNIIWQSFSGACNKSVVKHHNPNPNPNRNKFDNVNIFYDLLLRRNMSTLFYRRFILSDTLTSFWLVNNPIIVKQRILGFWATMKSIYFLSLGIKCSYTTELFQIIAKKACYLQKCIKNTISVIPLLPRFNKLIEA
jgi:hypothetical protein